ncbi:hypothetical protein NUU61_007350 [Penicillium alfredii]|uniref:Uncharacterized protein n=1 Tax=Penicillium alfredii TaxID=1506179 RepID=A0A9W9F2M0_9EURO|nr:uncharacterized protein NUU61_007350 [Penicillium alfredii]KAJ5092480.1 hypothetical protein NUU61_007350 [Penicillium alfredii]
MRWTQENENILWKTLFTTQKLNIDLDKLASNWPGDEKPTPKALKEHLSKYRKGATGDSMRRNTAKAPIDDEADVPENDNGASEVQIKPDPELEDVANQREYASETLVKEEVMNDY